MTLCISILKKILNFNLMHIDSCDMIDVMVKAFGGMHQQKQLVVHARPFKRKMCRCPICGKKCPMNGYKLPYESKWRAPNLNGMPVYIFYRPHRILCPEHGSINEFIPWADGTSRFTPDFNNDVAWLACRTTRSAVCEFLGINWRTVGNCIKAVHDRLEPDVKYRIHDDLRRICVDETSYRKGYKYITVVYDMDRNRVVWLSENHGYSVFEEFCQELTQDERDNIEIVAGDGARWIDSCTSKYFHNATRCIDFFHVVEWTTASLDKVRSNTVAKAKYDYNRLKEDFKKAEAEAAAAVSSGRKQYEEAVSELESMPRRGRRSRRKKELMAFVAEYESIMAGTENIRNVGRPRKEQFSSEHQTVLDELCSRISDLKGAKYALGHNPDKCTDAQHDKLELIENSYPDLYRAYKLKEDLRIILHMKDYEQAGIELDKWITEASGSGLKPMTDLSDKISRHRANILNSIKFQANSAKSEATNTTIKGLIKIARGFRNMKNLFALIYLKCSDLIIPLSNRNQPDMEYLKKKRDHDNELRKIREEKRTKGMPA